MAAPPHQAHKPKLKPKPVLQRWNFTEKEDDVVLSAAATNLKTQQRHLPGNHDHLKKTVATTKPPVDKSSKPKLLPKPEAKASSIEGTAGVQAAPGRVTKPLAKPRKISDTRGQNTEHIQQTQAFNSSVDPLRRDPVSGIESSNKELSRSNETGLHNTQLSNPGSYTSGDQDCASNPEPKVTRRKLRKTLLRGFEVAFKGNAEPLNAFRRRSEEIGDIKEEICISRGESNACKGNVEPLNAFRRRSEEFGDIKEGICLSEGESNVEGTVDGYSTEGSNDSEYDDVEIVHPKHDGGFVQVDVTSTQAISIPKPAPRWKKKFGSSDRGTRRKKLESQERFKSDPDLIRTSALYDDIELLQDSAMNRGDGRRETVSSGGEYEEIDDPPVRPSLARSTENIALPYARSPTAPKLLEKVRTKVGKTMDKAKNRFFTSSQASVVPKGSSPTNRASPVGSPNFRSKEISPPIPEKPTSVSGHVVKVTPGMRSSSSDPVIQNMTSRPILNKQISDNFPCYPPPPPPTDQEVVGSSCEDVLPPVPPRGSSREMDSLDESINALQRHVPQTLHTEDPMARCESLEEIDTVGKDDVQVRESYLHVPLSYAHDGEEAYSEVVMGVTRPTLRKQSTGESGHYVDWGDLESTEDHPVTTKDRANSSESTSSEPNYLDFSDDVNLEKMVSRKQRFQSRFVKKVSLYQNYTREVIARSSWDTKGENSFDVEDPEYYELLASSRENSSVFEEPIEKKTSEISTSCPSIGIRSEFFTKTGTGMRTLWCEMPEVQNSGVLSGLDPQEKKVQEAMFEVITSEASYLKSLNVLVDNFLMAPEFSQEHSVNCVLDRRSKHFLFSNLLAVRDVSERLLFDLETRWQESTNFLLENVCDILYSHASETFECYVKYCSNQVYQERTLKELMKNQDFLEARLKLEANPECQGLNMTSFLLLPMQRITRLPLLIDAICHRLDPEKEMERHQSAMNALVILKKIVKECNDGAKKMAQTEEMCLIDRQLVFKEPIKRIGLISATRHLVKRGEFIRIVNDLSGRRPFSKAKASKQMIYLFLFTDLLLVTKKKSEDLFSVIDYAQRSSLLVEPIDDTTNEPRLKLGVPSKCDHLFILVLLENYEGKSVEFILSCESPSDRARWMEAITPVQENTGEKIYEAWDCPQVQVIHAYTAQQPDELTLEESDVVNVLRKITDGWYEGERIRDGQKGWFPAEYTVEIKNSHVRNRNLRQRYRLLAAASRAISDVLPPKPKRIDFY